MNKLPLIEKIYYLESILGEKNNYKLFEPIKFDSTDIIKVHETAFKIAQHLGLNKLSFSISYGTQKANIAGIIELNNDNYVFIEIDPKYKQDSDIIQAILAHEICHKYLQVRNIKLFPEYENEILTDATTIYTGLGKLSLNGCKKNNGAVTHTIGYMNRSQFCFIYRLVNEMRNISLDETLKGLNLDAHYETINISNENYSMFDPLHLKNEIVVQELNDTIKNEIGNAQRKIANLSRDIKLIQTSLLKSIEEDCIDFHSYTKDKIDTLSNTANRTFNNERQNYLKNLLTIEEIIFYRQKIIDLEKQISKSSESVTQFKANLTTIKINSKINDEILLRQFECPVCKHRMRIGENKLAQIKCPNCKYNFVVNATKNKDFNQTLSDSNYMHLEKNTVQQETKINNQKKQKRTSWLNSIKEHFHHQ